MQLQAVFLMDKFITKNMVQMTVGIDKKRRLELFFRDKGSKLLTLCICITAWVYNDTLIKIIVNQIGVLLEGVELKNFNV
jgi:hypothetical protein